MWEGDRCTRPRNLLGFPGGSAGRESACNAGDLGSIARSGRSPGERNGNPLQYSGLGNPMDAGAWWAIVHGVAKSWTRLSDFTFTTHVPQNQRLWVGVTKSVFLTALQVIPIHDKA